MRGKIPTHTVKSDKARLRAVAAWGAHSLSREDAASAAGQSVAFMRCDPTAGFKVGLALQNAQLGGILDLLQEICGVDLLTPFERDSMALTVAGKLGSHSDQFTSRSPTASQAGVRAAQSGVDNTPASIAMARRWAVSKYVAYCFLVGGMAVLPANIVAAATQGKRDLLHAGDTVKLSMQLHKFVGDIIAGGQRGIVSASTLVVMAVASTLYLQSLSGGTGFSEGGTASPTHRAEGVSDLPMSKVALRDLTAACILPSLKGFRPTPPPSKTGEAGTLKLLPWLRDAQVQRQNLLGAGQHGWGMEVQSGGALAATQGGKSAKRTVALAEPATPLDRLDPPPMEHNGSQRQSARDSEAGGEAGDGGDSGSDGGGYSDDGYSDGFESPGDEGGGSDGEGGVASSAGGGMSSGRMSMGGGSEGGLGGGMLDAYGGGDFEAATGVGTSSGHRQGMAAALITACCLRIDPRDGHFPGVPGAGGGGVGGAALRAVTPSTRGGRGGAGGSSGGDVDMMRSMDDVLASTGPLLGLVESVPPSLGTAKLMLAAHAEAKRQAKAKRVAESGEAGTQKRIKKKKRRTPLVRGGRREDRRRGPLDPPNVLSGGGLDAALAARNAAASTGSRGGDSDDMFSDGDSAGVFGVGGESVNSVALGAGGTPLPPEARAAKRLGARNLYDGKWLSAFDSQLAVLMRDLRTQVIGGRPSALPSDVTPYLDLGGGVQGGAALRESTVPSVLQDGDSAVDAFLVACSTPAPVGTGMEHLRSPLGYLAMMGGEGMHGGGGRQLGISRGRTHGSGGDNL